MAETAVVGFPHDVHGEGKTIHKYLFLYKVSLCLAQVSMAT